MEEPATSDAQREGGETPSPPMNSGPAPESVERRAGRALKNGLKRFGLALKNNDSRINNYVQVVAIILAGIWAILYTFVWSEIIKPSNERPSIPISATLKTAGKVERVENGQKRIYIAVKVGITALNTSKTRIIVMNAFFNVRGYNFKSDPACNDKKANLEAGSICSDKAYNDYVKRRLAQSSGDTIASRHDKHEMDGGTIVHSSNLMQGWTMTPGDQYSRTSIFYVPADFYDHLELRFDLYIARQDGYAEEIENRWSVDEDGALFADFYVKHTGVTKCDDKNPLTNCDELNGHDDNQKRLFNKYGLTHYDANDVLSLWTIPSAPVEEPTTAGHPVVRPME